MLSSKKAAAETRVEKRILIDKKEKNRKDCGCVLDARKKANAQEMKTGRRY
jgi:hypothetical protein